MLQKINNQLLCLMATNNSNNNRPTMPSPENNNNTVIKAGQLCMFTAARRVLPYYLYDSKENATINPGEPFLVIKTGCPLNGFNNMVLVCNVRGEVGMTYPRSDIIPYLSQ